MDTNLGFLIIVFFLGYDEIFYKYRNFEGCIFNTYKVMKWLEGINDIAHSHYHSFDQTAPMLRWQF